MASIRAMAQTAAAGRVCPRAGMVGAATVGRRGIKGGKTLQCRGGLIRSWSRVKHCVWLRIVYIVRDVHENVPTGAHRDECTSHASVSGPSKSPIAFVHC